MVVSGSTVYLGGNFTTINGTLARNYLAAVDTTNGTATGWSPNANGFGYSLAVSGSGVYAGGAFNLLNLQTRNRLAAFDPNGVLTAWNPNANSTVYALAVSGAKVYAGGAFTTIGGTTRNRLAAVGTTNGALDTTWNPNANNTVYALIVKDGRVYAGGQFTTLGGSTTRNYLAAMDATSGTLDADWNPNAGGGVRALTLRNGTLYVGGIFTTINGGIAARNRLAAVNTTGTGMATAWDPDASSDVYALAVNGDTVYVGGAFNGVNAINGNLTRNRLAAVDAATGTATDWNPNADNVVNALAVTGNTVYAGGAFTTIGVSSIRNRLAAIGMDGTLSPWNPNADGTVQALAISGDTVYAGGVFTTLTSEIKASSPTAYLSYLNGPPCGVGLSLATSPALWQQLALPCVPDTTTIGETLGANTTGQLDATIYGNAAANGWLMYGNDLINNKNLKLAGTDPLDNGVGYWLKSFAAPAGGGNLTVSGTATPAPVRTVDGCASANGCKAIAVTTVAGADRYNLVGNPFPYNVDWAKVRGNYSASPWLS